MGSFGFGYLQQQPVNPIAYAQQFAQLRALGELRQQRQQEMALRQQEAAQTQQINAMKIQEAQQAQAQTQAVNDAYREAFDPNQPSGYDLGKLQSSLAQKGYGAAFAGEMEHLGKVATTQQALTEHKFKLEDLQADHGGAIGAAVKAEDYDPRLFLTYAQAGLRNGTISREKAQPAIESIMTSFAMDPSGAQAKALTKHYSDNLIANSPAQQKLLKERGETEAKTVELAGKRKEQAIADLRSLPADPQTGLPTAEAWAGWTQAHPEMKAPATPTTDYVEKQIEATVPPKELPEYRLKQQQAEATRILMQNPEKLNVMIGGSINPKQYPDQFQRTWNDARNALILGKGVEGVNAAIKDGSDRVAARENAAAQAAITTIPARENAAENRKFQQGQQSYNTAVRELDQINKPVDDAVARFGRLQATLNQNSPQADALVAPELLTVMAGGTGSGLRMNEAEIARVIGGRSKWEDLKSAINHWQLDPSKATSITDAQRKQIRGLVDEVGKKLTARAALMNDARNALAGSNDPMEHRRTMVDLHNKLTKLDMAGEQAGGGAAQGGYQIGHMYGGFTYLGGDPNQQSSWRKSQ